MKKLLHTLAICALACFAWIWSTSSAQEEQASKTSPKLEDTLKPFVDAWGKPTRSYADNNFTVEWDNIKGVEIKAEFTQKDGVCYAITLSSEDVALLNPDEWLLWAKRFAPQAAWNTDNEEQYEDSKNVKKISWYPADKRYSFSYEGSERYSVMKITDKTAQKKLREDFIKNF